MKTISLKGVLVFTTLVILSACTRSATAGAGRAELIKKLTPEQYKVTQENGTEAPFKNAYWNNHQDGIYVDIVSGEPLFSSQEKYDSGTGWPSFWAPLVKANIVEKVDVGPFTTRNEIRSAHANSHLGHVFNDGPKPTGLRYCMNSAAMKFIPAAELDKNGLGEFAALFQKKSDKDLAKSTEASEQSIVFAGGCFWGVQAVFKHVKGVTSSVSGYSGGTTKNPAYGAVSSGGTGHAESVKVTFDPSKVKLETLLKIFFNVAHNPTELNRQGPDSGTQYRSAIFYTTDAQKQETETYIGALTAAKTYAEPIVTQVKKIDTFYPAEDYHQNYAELHPLQPYIYFNDRPKIEKLRKEYPDLWN